MNDLEYIAENLSDEDILCQIAEEASELAQAALKLRRAITQTNPTPVTKEEAVDNLIEEFGDVCGSFLVYTKKNKLRGFMDDVSISIFAKYSRWALRIREAEKNGN